MNESHNQLAHSQTNIEVHPEPRAQVRPTASHSIDIAFKNITYSIEIEKKVDKCQLPCNKEKQTKIILNNISGVFKAGQVSAILGASGAGKTSLLNIIACRISPVEGSLLANTTEYDYNSFGDFANYVMQTDVLMQTLTVKEALMFAADLRLDISLDEKEERVRNLTNSMKLERCLDTLIGGDLIKGISGGQKKRTSIAFQLISDPQVIMLDEPTSGLDSLTSYVIVDYLRKLATQQGKTIIMTIHQPGTDIYARFDRLFLMVQGRIVYQGDAHKAVDYFSSNFGFKCAEFQNPAEYLIEHTHNENQSNKKRFEEYYATYDQKITPMIEKEIDHLEKGQLIHRENHVPTSTALKTLLYKDCLNIWRNPMHFKSRLLQSLILGIYIGGLYFDLGTKDYTQPLNWAGLSGFLFFLNITMFMSSLSPIALVFPTERAVFLKEQNSRLYNVFTYFISRNIVEVPYLVLMPFILILIFYWMVDLSSNAEQFFKFYLAVFLVGICGNSLGLLLGSVITDAKSVSAAVPIVLLPFVLFSGFFKNTGNIPLWFGWIQYLSPFKYGFPALTENQTKYRPSLINQLNFDVTYWQSIGILCGLAISYRLISLFFLWYMRTKIQ